MSDLLRNIDTRWFLPCLILACMLSFAPAARALEVLDARVVRNANDE